MFAANINSNNHLVHSYHDSRTQRRSCTHCYKNPQNWIRITILIILLTVFITCISHPSLSVIFFTNFLTWVKNNPWNGACVFILVYIFNNIFLIPGMILSTGAGYIYSQSMGIWPGSIFATFITLIACVCGSSLGFLNGRYLFRKIVHNFVYKSPTFMMIDYAVKKHGFRVTFLFRLSPGTPYCYFNYIMGCTSVRFADYMMGALGMIPNIFAYCFVGASVQQIYELSSLNPKSNEAILILTIIGLFLIVIAFFYLAWIAKKEIQKLTKETNAEKIRQRRRMIDGENSWRYSNQYEIDEHLQSDYDESSSEDDVFKEVLESDSDLNIEISEIQKENKVEQ